MSTRPDDGDMDLSAALGELVDFIRRYVAFPSEHEPVAIALWIVHAYAVEHFETSPILAITSAEMRSGKTRVLDCMELLVPHPFRVVTPSEAVVYTVLSQRPRRTMLLDEADAIFGTRTAERHEGLRAILNAGNRQGTPVLRVKLEGRRRAVDEFDVYGPKAIAGIGKLPDTVTDRAIPIRMKRRAPGEPVARFRRRTAKAEADAISIPSVSVPLVPDVPVPETLNDRAADSWEPLLVIAEIAGQTWPVRARLAAIALSAEDEMVVSDGMRLLAEVRDAFDAKATDHLSTHDLLSFLHELEEAPWGDWYGKPLTPRALARLLDPYDVAPVRQRVGGTNQRGYFRSDFEDAWTRYVPVAGRSVPDVPVVPVPETDSLWAVETSTPTPPLPPPHEQTGHADPSGAKSLPRGTSGTTGTTGTPGTDQVSEPTPFGVGETVAGRYLRSIGEDS